MPSGSRVRFVDALHEGEAGAEDPRLLVGPAGQLAAADAAREAEVVADRGAGRRLAAERRPSRSPGCAAPRTRRRRPRTGRAGPPPTMTRSYCSPVRSRPLSPRPLAISDVARVLQDLAVGQDQERQLRRADAGEEGAALVGVGQVEPVRNRTALEHGAQLVRPARPGLADHVRPCAERAAGPRPRRAGSWRSPGGTARPAAATGGRRSGRCGRGRSPRRSRHRSAGRPAGPTRRAGRVAHAGTSRRTCRQQRRPGRVRRGPRPRARGPPARRSPRAPPGSRAPPPSSVTQQTR